MNYDFNSLISKLSSPFWITTGNHSLFFLSDAKGKILKFWNKETYVHQNDIVRPLVEKATLFECFDFKGATDLSRLNPDLTVFPGKFDVFNRTILESFSTLLPLTSLRIASAGDNLFLCAVQISNLVPNIYNPEGGAMIFVDNEDRIAGLNDNFFNYFKDSYSRPHELLGKPCKAFLSPTPKDIQEQYFATLLEPPEPKSAPEPLDREWDNPSDRIVFMTLPPSLNTFKQDFRLEVEFTSEKSHYPLLLLGDKPYGDFFPDIFGYTLSTGSENGLVTLKKYGHALSRSNSPVPHTGKTLRYQWIKQGAAFLFAVNGTEIHRFYDFDLLEKPEALVLLGLRPGNRLHLNNAVLSVRHCTPPVKHEDTIVRLNTPGKPFFAINRFYNDGLSNQNPPVNGYILRDITALKKDMERWQGLYLDQKQEGERLRGLLSRREGPGDPFLGESAAIRLIKEKAAVIANSSATLLIQGETGTGKEVLANYIHGQSPYAKGPFLKVDCSTLAPTLIESELFGHEKGAFTGAVQEKKGKFEQAQGGTLFLDEVNNLGPDVQAKILNFLQDFTITRIGGQKPLKLDLRIIIASNIRLEEMVRRGMFRQDLYFRINIISIELPPLRERRDDIPQLCDHFLSIFNIQHRKQIQGLTPAAFRRLYDHHWPGNVRELRNVIYRAVIFCEKAEIDESLIQLQSQEPGLSVSSKRLGESGGDQIVAMLTRHRGNVRRAARSLGLSRQSFYYNCKKHGVDVKGFRKQAKKPG